MSALPDPSRLTDELALADVDADGAIAEAHERVSRLQLLRAAAAGGAAVLLSAPGRASAARSATKNDVAILNYALTLEYLQAAFYTETERVGALRGKAARAARVVGAVERAHVSALRRALGPAAVKRPRFNFQGTTEDQTRFLKTAVAFEDLAAAAYKGQAPLIDSKAVLASAVSIHSVEARHAAWMRFLFGIVPAATAFDRPLSRDETLRIVASTNFIASRAPTTGRGRPRFTG